MSKWVQFRFVILNYLQLLPKKNPKEAQANKDCTNGLEITGPNIIFINPLSAKSKDPVANVRTPKTLEISQN